MIPRKYRIKHYKILSGFAADLEVLVIDHIDEGWELFGPPTRDQFGCFFQTMVQIMPVADEAIRYPVGIETRTDQLK